VSQQPVKAAPWPAAVGRGRLASSRQRVVYDAWQAIRGTKGFPARAALDLRAIKKALGTIALLDVLRENTGKPRGFRIRLWGTKLVDWTGVEATGRVITAETGPRVVLRRLQRVVSTAAPLFAKGVLVPWSPYDYKRFHVLALPLGARPPLVDQILCVFEPAVSSPDGI